MEVIQFIFQKKILKKIYIKIMENLIKFLITLLYTIIMICGSSLFFSWVVMLLWNWLMPDIFGLKEITWLQALGLNFLTGLLFSRINYNMK